MFAKKPNAEAEELNQEISRVLAVLGRIEPDDEEYAKAADQLVKLYDQKAKIPSRRVNPDTLLTVSGNLLGILVIVGHERANVITSKALGFAMKSFR